MIRDGRALCGVVSAPALGLAYWGGRGIGSYREDDGVRAPLTVAANAALARPLRVVASESHLDSATQAWIAALGSVQLMQAGSSLKICRVAEGSAGVYLRLGPTCEWDTAAAQAVLEVAGGVLCTLTGSALAL